MLVMDSKADVYKEVFDSLLDADKCLWKAVLDIQDRGDTHLNGLINSLMQIRGEIHTEIMRPIYKQHPELAEQAGFDQD